MRKVYREYYPRSIVSIVHSEHVIPDNNPRTEKLLVE